MPKGPPARCSTTRIGKHTLATAGHCIWPTLAPYIGKPIEITTELAGVWLTVEGKIFPEFPFNFASRHIRDDLALLKLNEEDLKYLEGLPIYPPCEKGPELKDDLRGTSQWSGTTFKAKLQKMEPENYLSFFPIVAEAHKRFIGIIEEESGGGLFKMLPDNTLCWLAALSVKPSDSIDFSLNASYSGSKAFNWAKPLIN